MKTSEKIRSKQYTPEEEAFLFWGKLVSLNNRHPNITLFKDSYKIGRDPSNDIVIDDPRISQFHCVLTKQPDHQILLEDKSSNGVFFKKKKIGKENVKVVQHSETFYLLHPS